MADADSGKEPHSQALAYFLTFRTYGTWLPGDDRGSTDRLRNAHDSPHEPPSPARRTFSLDRMAGTPVSLDAFSAGVADAAIRELCDFRDWHLSALNVRTNHVHLVVSALPRPSV